MLLALQAKDKGENPYDTTIGKCHQHNNIFIEKLNIA